MLNINLARIACARGWVGVRILRLERDADPGKRQRH